ncbi:thiamine pyrophosphate-binding protein [Candidatus Pelagibacter sp.]|jgi:acetolactate synthase I/II/III large subunit|nr:thiamine pyrophosphate-binding protein [Candidatus Pelagibacter sp.]
MNLSDYTLKFLEKKKVKKVFLLNGGSISFMIDAFTRNKKIKYIAAAHEQSAAMMADAYSRLGPNFSCTMVTSGPGATNIITGIACSYFDSIPSLHICGQVNTYEQRDGSSSTKNVRQVGFQETDIVNIAKHITKYAYKLKDASEIRYVLEKAYYLAISGRPGPVLIDIPMNLQRVQINPKKLRSFKPKSEKKIIKFKNLINKIEKLLTKSKKPVIILGGGIKYGKAEVNLINFLKIFKIPIVATWSAVDLIDYNNKNYIGNIGVYGSRAANFTVQNSDLILCLGTRLDTRVTGGVPSSFARNAKKIVVDIDKYELRKKRGLKIDLKIQLDVKVFLEEYKKRKTINIIRNDWLLRCNNWKIKYPIILKEFYNEKKYVNPYIFVDKLSDKLNKNDVIILSTGAHLSWGIQAFKIKFGQKLFSAFGNSPMGYALPASIAASLVKKNNRIICMDGDGSIQLNIQDLNTIYKLQLPIKIFIFNNGGYGIIKQFQELYLEKRYEASGKGVSNPSFKKISDAYNINYNFIKTHSDLKKLDKIISTKRPEIIEINIRNNQKIIPKLQFRKPIEDLSPLLSREEFNKNMDI